MLLVSACNKNGKQEATYTPPAEKTPAGEKGGNGGDNGNGGTTEDGNTLQLGRVYKSSELQPGKLTLHNCPLATLLTIEQDKPATASDARLDITSSSSPVVVAGTLSDDCAVQLDGKDWATLERAADSPEMLITKVKIFSAQSGATNVLKTTIASAPAGVEAEHLYTTVDGGEQWHEVKDNYDDMLNKIALANLAGEIITPHEIAKPARYNQVLLRLSHNGKQWWQWGRIRAQAVYIGADEVQKVKRGFGFSLGFIGIGAEEIQMLRGCGLRMFAKEFSSGKMVTIPTDKTVTTYIYRLYFLGTPSSADCKPQFMFGIDILEVGIDGQAADGLMPASTQLSNDGGKIKTICYRRCSFYNRSEQFCGICVCEQRWWRDLACKYPVEIFLGHSEGHYYRY